MRNLTQAYIETLQENLLDAHSKHEDSVDVLASYIENDLDLSVVEYEKLDELLQKVYATLEEIKFQIL